MAGGRPSKPIELIKMQNKTSKRTKAQIELREKKEKESKSGTSWKESDLVKGDPIAHKEFTRLNDLFKKINHNDDINSNVINTHCLLVSECEKLQVMMYAQMKAFDNFNERVKVKELTFAEEISLKNDLSKSIIDTDKILMTKRKMLLDIAKENLLTIQSVLRSIPKKPIEEAKEDPMAKFLSAGG